MQATPTKACSQPHQTLQATATAQRALLSADTGHSDQGLLTASSSSSLWPQHNVSCCWLTQATLTKACSQPHQALQSAVTAQRALLSVDAGCTESHQALQFMTTAQCALLSADSGLLTASGRGNPRTQKHSQLKLSALGFKPPFLGQDAHPSR